MAQVDFILTGYERGGTTLLSDVFRANGYESGFECGVLMEESPKHMPKLTPYWEMLMAGWRISEAARQEAISGDFQHFYDVICHSAFPDFTGNFFDKTPIYMSQLGLCMHRAPNLKGAVVIHRDPRALFLSMAKRLSPNLQGVEAIETNFEYLTERYIRYFLGSISHYDNPQVLFVPFEDLISREDTWLKNIGNFAIGSPFVKRVGKPRFNNVSSSKMELQKGMEFCDVLPQSLQDRILEATNIASLFFSDATDRSKFGQYWQDIHGEANAIMTNHDMPRSLVLDDGTYFEPLTYILRYEDVRRSRVNPASHFLRNGKKEKRVPN